ncbi:MAG: ABC transporter ATP-binding protein [Alphaproteobacteria bacterium]|nr:ABC transporter ATP-binding protein [Alphaproteobacteria bacterium]MCB9690002.1 ABC transporter ATP-binding protein [Alphaproteobacteria bacterium]
MSVLCDIKDVKKVYGSGPAAVQALRGVNLTIDEGEFTVISGPSGSGKSTLLNLVGCLDVCDEGVMTLLGHDVKKLSPKGLAQLRAERIGFIFQSFNLIPVLTARENVELALQLAGDTKGDRVKRASEALDRVGLGDYLHRRPNQLSGGQQQRVAVARALVKEPALVVADEPTANLDSNTGAAVLDLMRDMNKQLGITFLFSTHDPLIMVRARRILLLRDGQIEDDEIKTRSDLTREVERKAVQEMLHNLADY